MSSAPIGQKWRIEDKLKAAALSYVHALDTDMFSQSVVVQGEALVGAAREYSEFMKEYPVNEATAYPAD